MGNNKPAGSDPANPSISQAHVGAAHTLSLPTNNTLRPISTPAGSELTLSPRWVFGYSGPRRLHPRFARVGHRVDPCFCAVMTGHTQSFNSSPHTPSLTTPKISIPVHLHVCCWGGSCGLHGHEQTTRQHHETLTIPSLRRESPMTSARVRDSDVPIQRLLDVGRGRTNCH